METNYGLFDIIRKRIITVNADNISVKKNDIKFIESEHRFCPICDQEIEMGSPIHKCSKKKLRELEKLSKDFHDDYSEEERTYDDKLRESEEQYDNNTYYDMGEE